MAKNPSGFCKCGCGRKTAMSLQTRRGYKRGERMMYIRGHQQKPVIYEVDHETGCWNWRRPLSCYGYGRVTRNGRTIGAHQYFYTTYIGQIPKGCEIHHTCANPRCVNPSHLTAISRRQHMIVDGRPPFGNKKAKVADVLGATQ